MALVLSIPLVASARRRGDRGDVHGAPSRRICLPVVIAAFLMACKPAVEPSVTGKVELEFVRTSQSDIYFRLVNQTADAISFRGTVKRSVGAKPWDVFMKCKEVQSQLWTEGPYALVDGGPESVDVPAGERVDLVVALDLHREFVQQYKGGQCTLNLKLQDGTTIESNEFQP